MTTRTTPGPWVANQGGDASAPWCVDDESGVACICEVHRGNDGDATGEANARLIAAAPEMLELLREVKATAEMSRGQYEEVKALLARIDGVK